MDFHSILFLAPEDEPGASVAQPACFQDLNLDQVVSAVVRDWESYQLDAFFHHPLTRPDAILYRHAVFLDLEEDDTRETVRHFGEAMRNVRLYVEHSVNLHYELQCQRWLLNAVSLYTEAVDRLTVRLSGLSLQSQGLRKVRDYLVKYRQTAEFKALQSEAKAVTAALSAVTYNIRFTGGGFEVSRYDQESDYGQEVEAVFSKFKQGDVEDSRATFKNPLDMNHIEAKILEFVSQLFPGPFDQLATFVERHKDFLDPVLVRFDREVQFYLAYLAYCSPIRAAGLPFCYPDRAEQKSAQCIDAFDLALARKCIRENIAVVTNDFRLSGHERIIVISGPNQGGKTTFARMFGQLHFLARLGVPVPGTGASLFLCDGVFTHFEKEEDSRNLHGKLEDDLLRIHAILERLTPNSVVILNEIFHSTTLSDARFLTREILNAVCDRDCLGVCVTFVDEMASLNEKTVSMVSVVEAGDLTARTYKIIRRPADGLAYAMSLAEKYGLTYTQMLERLPS